MLVPARLSWAREGAGPEAEAATLLPLESFFSDAPRGHLSDFAPTLPHRMPTLDTFKDRNTRLRKEKELAAPALSGLVFKALTHLKACCVQRIQIDSVLTKIQGQRSRVKPAWWASESLLDGAVR